MESWRQTFHTDSTSHMKNKNKTELHVYRFFIMYVSMLVEIMGFATGWDKPNIIK